MSYGTNESMLQLSDSNIGTIKIKERKYGAHHMRITHMENKFFLEQESFRKRLKEQLRQQLRQHREKLGLNQVEVAGMLCKSHCTYQRWESTGDHLTNIYDIRETFRVLDFSTTEIINLLGLPPLKLDELEEILPDENALRNIEEQGIYSYVRKKCDDMDNRTIDRILKILLTKRFNVNKKV